MNKRLVGFLITTAMLLSSCAGLITANAEGNNFFYYGMHPDSEFAYKVAADGTTISYEPMIATSGVAVSPKIINDTTYVPFRYLFETMLDFTDATVPNVPFDEQPPLNDKQYVWGYVNVKEEITGEEKTRFFLKLKYGEKEWTVDDSDNYKVTYPNGKESKLVELVDGNTYIPPRYFADQKMCAIDWIAETRSILLCSDGPNIEHYYNITENIAISNNFMTYSDSYKDRDGEVKSLTARVDGDAYSVSSNFNINVYSNKERAACYHDIDSGKTNEFKIKGLEGVLVDRIVICGDTIYGLKVTEGNMVRGTLFKAKIKLEECKNEDGTGIHPYSITKPDGTVVYFDIAATDITDINGANDVIMFSFERQVLKEIKAERTEEFFMYYIDAGNGYTLKRYDVLNDKIDTIKANNAEIKNADYFAIGQEGIIYNDFNEKKVKYAPFIAGSKTELGTPQTVQENADIYFLLPDDKNNRFFYVSVSGEKNTINCYVPGTPELTVYAEAKSSEDKIRNISIIDGNVYVKLNGVLTPFV